MGILSLGMVFSFIAAMKWLRNNSLSLAFFLLFVISIAGQSVTGFRMYNEEMKEKGGKQVTAKEYFFTGHFIEATFENWESEFLQMALFVVLAIFLYQKGSSESKDPDKAKAEVDREPNSKRKNAPWPVHKGGLILGVYKHSLTLALTLLFLLSFIGHLYGSLKSYNHDQVLKKMPTETVMQYLLNRKLWFESFQNWQSEFLSIFAITILSIYLRQKGSPQSKPVDAPHTETEA